MLTISIIIPNLNGEKFLLTCLESLAKNIQRAKSVSEFEIILVDNNSSDNSCQYFLDFCLDNKIKFQIIKLPKNYGFAGAVNRGVEVAKSDWVLVCNNDLKIADNWLVLVSKSMNSKFAAITGTVLNYDGSRFESQGLKFFYSGKCDNISNGQPFLKSNLSNLKSIPIWGASAALTLYNKKIFDQVGCFDEDFFAYEEDVDLALRLHNLGYTTLYVPKALSYHLGGATSSRMGNFRHRMDAKNWIYIIAKNYTKKEFWQNFFPIIEQRLRNLSGLIKNTPLKDISRDVFKTYGEVFKTLPKILKKRYR